MSSPATITFIKGILLSENEQKESSSQHERCSKPHRGRLPGHRVGQEIDAQDRLLGRFSQTTNTRPNARRITPPRKIAAIGAPVFARLPVEATGCVPLPASDDVVAPAPSFGLVVSVAVVALSGIALGIGESVGAGVGEPAGVGLGLGLGLAPGLGLELGAGVAPALVPAL
jgi:hypothetical protein